MKQILKIISALVFLIGSGCGASNFEPSVANLASNETLVMKYRSCHWECTKGIVKFRNGQATFGLYDLNLTPEEVSDLDNYFSRGSPLNTNLRCSMKIHISFKRKRRFFTTSSKEKQIYPCISDDDYLTPEDLVWHFTETPRETPYWRLSQEEKDKRNALILPINN